MVSLSLLVSLSSASSEMSVLLTISRILNIMQDYQSDSEQNARLSAGF
jgi:hypothetical protein